jgi:hypothetical protein
MVHLILRPHFFVGSLSDLKQDAQHVWLGPCRSGSRGTTERLLQASGIAEAEVDQLFSDCAPHTQSAMPQIKDWKPASHQLLAPTSDVHLDAFFWTRAVQTIGQPPQGSTNCDKDATSNAQGQNEDGDPIYCLLEGEAHFGALQPELIDRMATDNLYVETAIPLDAYGGKRLQQGVPTVGLATVLIAPDSFQKDDIRNLIAMIEKNKTTIEQKTGIELDLLDKKIQEHEHLASFEHAGAQSHLKRTDLTIARIMAVGSLAALLLLLIYRTPRWLTANPPALSYTVLLFAILLLLWGGFALKLKQAEGRFNPNFETLATSMWSMLSYIVGSFRDRRPVTREGETLIAWALFVIPLVFGWLTSDIIREGVRKLSNWLVGAISRLGSQLRALKRPS